MDAQAGRSPPLKWPCVLSAHAPHRPLFGLIACVYWMLPLKALIPFVTAFHKFTLCLDFPQKRSGG
jgi:hypothetical protein